MQVSIEKAELHWTTNSEANRLRHWIWKKPIVQHCNMVHDRMVMIWKVQWCSWINQNESFSIISKLQNEKRKESRLYYISKRYLTLGLFGSVFAFLTSRKPQCLGMHLWTVRRVRNARDNIWLSKNSQKGQLYALHFCHKNFQTSWKKDGLF